MMCNCKHGSAIMRTLALSALILYLLCVNAYAAEELTLWHSYRGDEKLALEEAVRSFNASHPELQVAPLAVPHEAYANKLTSAIPRGHGPDVFIFAHERLGDWSRAGLLAPVTLEEKELERYYKSARDALTYEGKFWGLPLALKSAALYYNPRLVPIPPKDTDEMLKIMREISRPEQGVYGLAYEAGSFYFHAAWLFGFGGYIFNDKNEAELNAPANIRSVEFVQSMMKERLIPEEPNAALVAQLFNEGRAGMVINGPWFAGEISKDVSYDIVPLPIVSATGQPAAPFLTVEAIFMSSKAKDRDNAFEFMCYLADDAAGLRATTGRQAVALTQPLLPSGKQIDPLAARFLLQAPYTVAMPNHPLMRAVWEPAAQALRKVMRGAAEPTDAMNRAQLQLRVLTRPAPPEKSPSPYIALLLLIIVALIVWLLVWMKRHEGWRDMRRAGTAYAYLLPAALSMILLLFLPFIVGTAVAFFSHHEGEFTFVGIANFVSILTSSDYAVNDPLSFYFTLVVTVLWTAANVFLHVTLGMALALMLRHKWLKLRGVYRVLLIVPWAVPNYITALIWKGMFHKQFGAINAFLAWFGVEPVSWFSHFWTSFAANVATNTWLGFPFMMVVTLGALQAIPADLEEAAEIDGAGPVRRFFSVTLPLLKPALLPAVILGSVWTFNMFNIIYLVSGGEPEGSTEILITEAYRWAFTRQEQYGYAAAYATLIFVALLIYSNGTRILMKEKT